MIVVFCAQHLDRQIGQQYGACPSQTVLDLTRVLAGPVATRFLAAFGANVLRIDPPSWDEPGVIAEVTIGKRCAGLDLHDADDRNRFAELLRTADILVHGYRPGASKDSGSARTNGGSLIQN